MKRFSLTEIQAQAILDMRLARLTNLEKEALEKEYLGLIKEIARLKSILESPKGVYRIIKEELNGLMKIFQMIYQIFQNLAKIFPRIII